MPLKFTFLKTVLLLPILLMLASPSLMAATSNYPFPTVVQHGIHEGKMSNEKRFGAKFLHRSKATGLEKKKTDGLAIAVFIGGLASFILVFPVKFFLGFAILGLATLITSIFAFRRIKRDGTRGRWLVILGILLVLVPGALFGLVFAALGKL